MSEVSQSEAALFASRFPLAGRASTGSRSERPVADRPRFDDVLANSKPAPVLKQTSKTSAEQMWQAKTEKGSERRKQERQEEYREHVDQQSGARINERSGVEARSAMSKNSLAQIPTAKTFDVSSDEKPDSYASELSGHEFTSSRPEPAVSLEPEHAEPAQARPWTRVDKPDEISSSEKTVSSSQSAPVIPIAAPTTDQVIRSARTYASDGPQVAKEVARFLATNMVSNAERDFGTGAVPGSSSRTNQGSPAPAKTTSETKETNISPNPQADAKSENTAKVSEFEKLVRLVRASSGKQSTARVMLDPPELGKVHVRVMVEGDRVEVGVETENDAARQMIGERAAKLKSVLEKNGFLMDRFDVTMNQTGLFDAHATEKAKGQKLEEQTNRESEHGLKKRSRDVIATSGESKKTQMAAPAGACRSFDFEV